MGFIAERKAALDAALGPKRYLLAPLFGVIAGFVDWIVTKLTEVGMGHLIGIPSWAIGLFVTLVTGTWWLLEAYVQLRTQVKDARLELAKLRHKGVKIRNDGMRVVKDEKSWRTWEKSALAWNRKVIREMKKLSEADASWFSILDTVPPPRIFPFYAPSDTELQKQFFKLFREHDFRVARLGDMIRDLWGKD